jgi:Tol biopolymer transport system component
MMTLPEISKRKNNLSHRSGLRRMLFVLFLLTAFVILQGFIAAFFYNAFKPQNDLPTARLTYNSRDMTYVHNLQTGEITQLYRLEYLDQRSPNGKWLFRWDVKGADQSYYNYDEAHLIVTETEEWSEFNLGLFYSVQKLANWSSDSQWLAFSASSSKNEQQTEIWMINLQTHELKSLTANERSSHSPVFSPDGTEIAYICDQILENHLCILNLETGVSRVLGPAAAEPSWSPDGRWIAYVTTQYDSLYGDIWITRADGTETQPITNPDRLKYGDGKSDIHPRWLP